MSTAPTAPGPESAAPEATAPRAPGTVRHGDGGTPASRTEGVLTLDRGNRIVDIDRRCAAMLGAEPRAVLDDDIARYLPGEVVRTLHSVHESRLRLNSGNAGAEYPIDNVLLRDARLLERRVDLAVRHVGIDGVPHTIVTVRDLDDVRSVGGRRREIAKYARFRTVAKLAPIGILELDADGGCLFANDMWCAMSERDPEASGERGWLGALHPDDVPAVLEGLRGGSSRDRVYRDEVRLCPSPGKIVWASLALTALLDVDGAAAGSLLTVTDVTERRLLIERLEELNRKDALTGLWNRTGCFEELDRLLGGDADGREGQGSVAVMYVDLDGFKGVNDTLGHDAGDELLRVVARRLRAAVRPQDSVARLGGDEFAVLLPDVEDRTAAAGVARCIVASISHSFRIDGQEVRVGASVGVAVDEEGEVDGAALVKRADTALYAAKRGGRSRYEFFTVGQDDRPLRAVATGGRGERGTVDAPVARSSCRVRRCGAARASGGRGRRSIGGRVRRVT